MQHTKNITGTVLLLAAHKHSGSKNIGRLAAIHRKPVRIKLVGGQCYGRLVMNRQICSAALVLCYMV